MSRSIATLGTVLALALLGAVPAAAEDQVRVEQTRGTFALSAEPICEANAKANRRIMNGARARISRNDFTPVSRQFQRLSASLGKMARQLAQIPPPVGDEGKIRNWLRFIRLLKSRIGDVAKSYAEASRAGTEKKRDRLKIRATHEAILAERAGLTANNVTVAFPFDHCRFRRVG